MLTPEVMKRRILFSVLFLSLLPIQAGAQEILHGCGMEGDARSPGVQVLNRLKNRYHAPAAKDIDPRVTLAALLEPGDDMKRWDSSRAANVTGYVHDVKVGGIESTNCHARDAANRDTHIELVLDPVQTGKTYRVIVEITPRWREMMSEEGVDWTTKGLHKTLLGRWVRVAGWLLFDVEHKSESENTSPGRKRNWRATAWEIHPVTSITVVNRPIKK